MNIKETEWYQSRPPLIKLRIDAYPPDRLYRMKSSGHIVPLYSYEEGEDGLCRTCTVLVLRRYNPFVFLERRVFGVHFTDLEMLSNQEENGYLGKVGGWSDALP